MCANKAQNGAKISKKNKNCRKNAKTFTKPREKKTKKNKHSCEKLAHAARPLQPPFSISDYHNPALSLSLLKMHCKITCTVQYLYALQCSESVEVWACGSIIPKAGYTQNRQWPSKSDLATEVQQYVF